MPLVAQFTFAETGNTVPYPPCTDGGRTNAGFKDIRGRPDLVDAIHETQGSPALTSFLRMLVENGDWISLGCDLGDHLSKEDPCLYLAGGYVQFTFDDFFKGYDFYRDLAEDLYHDLLDKARDDDWRISFEIGDVAYQVGDMETDIASLWVWFEAAAPSLCDAKVARERLIDALRISLLEPALAPLES